MLPVFEWTFRATGITAYLENSGTLEHAQQIATPPVTDEKLPLATLLRPAQTDEDGALAVLESPPIMAEVSPQARAEPNHRRRELRP